MKTLPHDSAAEEQASLWAARIEGSHLTAEKRAELDAWLAEHPAHRTLLSQYYQFSADLEQTLPALARAGAIDMPAAPRPEPARGRNGWHGQGDRSGPRRSAHGFRAEGPRSRGASQP